jgi:hypothetical protein
VTSRLVFTPSRHTYALDGKRVPGVTTIIRKATAKDALPPAAAKETALWAAANVDALTSLGADTWVKTAAGAYRDVWNARATLGTRLHEAARQLVSGTELTPVDPDTGEVWPDDEQRMAQHLARFMDEWDVTPLAAERPVYNDTDRWAGTLDLVARMRDGRRWLVDYKTGASGIWPETSLQLAAYRHATHVQVETNDGLADWPMPQVDECAALWVRPDGYELRPVRADRRVYDVFLSMMPVADWASWKREQSVYDPVPVPS